MSPLLAVGLLAGVGYVLFRFTRDSRVPLTVDPHPHVSNVTPLFMFDPCTRRGQGMAPCPIEITEANPLHANLVGGVELVGETTGDSIARAGSVTIIGMAAPGVLRVKLPNDPTHEVYRVSSDLVAIP